MDWLLQQLINGLALGSIYALIALGYTMVYGVLRFINFAHADVLMLGAYAAYFIAPAVSTVLPLPSLTGTLIIVLLSAMICAGIGMLIEILAYRPLRQRPRLTVCGRSVPPARPLPRPVHLRPLPPDLCAAGGR